MIKRLINHAGVLVDGNKSIVKWSANERTKKNLGDAINPYLFNEVFNKKAIHTREVLNIGFPKVYSLIGSILDDSITKNLVVMGSGFRKMDSIMKVRPSEVVACRGPLTRKKLQQMGLEVPEVYGDPAILLPNFFDVQVLKTNKIGVIPHIVDQELPVVKKLNNRADFKYIDICADFEDFIKDIKSCKFTISSSLHGIILSHAYNIPSIWVEFSDEVIGDGFKFDDYYLSLGLQVERLKLDNNNIDDIFEIIPTLPNLKPMSEKLLTIFRKYQF